MYELDKLPRKVLNCDGICMTPHTWNSVGTHAWGATAHVSQLTQIPMQVAPWGPCPLMGDWAKGVTISPKIRNGHGGTTRIRTRISKNYRRFHSTKQPNHFTLDRIALK